MAICKSFSMKFWDVVSLGATRVSNRAIRGSFLHDIFTNLRKFSALKVSPLYGECYINSSYNHKLQEACSKAKRLAMLLRLN